jgi:hypothetical protein
VLALNSSGSVLDLSTFLAPLPRLPPSLPPSLPLCLVLIPFACSPLLNDVPSWCSGGLPPRWSGYNANRHAVFGATTGVAVHLRPIRVACHSRACWHGRIASARPRGSRGRSPRVSADPINVMDREAPSPACSAHAFARCRWDACLHRRAVLACDTSEECAQCSFAERMAGEDSLVVGDSGERERLREQQHERDEKATV